MSNQKAQLSITGGATQHYHSVPDEYPAAPSRYYAAGQAPTPTLVPQRKKQKVIYLQEAAPAARSSPETSSETLLRVGVNVTSGLLGLFGLLYLTLLLIGSRMDDAHVAGWMRDAIKTESSFNYSFVKYLAYGYGTADKGPKDTPKLLTDLTTFVKNLPDLLPPGVPVPKALADFATFLQNLDPTVFTNFLSDSGANMFSVSVAQVVLMFVLALALQLAKCTPMLRKGSIVKRKGLLVFLVISLAMLFTAWVLHMLRWARVAQLFYAENDNVWYGIQANAPAPVYPADGSPPIIDFPDYFFFYRAVAGFLYASLLTKYGNIPTKEDIQQFASGDIDGDFNFQLGSGALWLCEMWMPILTITGFILLILGYCKLPTEMNAVAEIRNKDLDSEDEHLP